MTEAAQRILSDRLQGCADTLAARADAADLLDAGEMQLFAMALYDLAHVAGASPPPARRRADPCRRLRLVSSRPQ